MTDVQSDQQGPHIFQAAQGERYLEPRGVSGLYGRALDSGPCHGDVGRKHGFAKIGADRLGPTSTPIPSKSTLFVPVCATGSARRRPIAPDRSVPLHPHVLEILLEWKKESVYKAGGDFPFPSIRRNGKQPLSPDSLLKRDANTKVVELLLPELAANAQHLHPSGKKRSGCGSGSISWGCWWT
jgi:hypothetical protein